MSQEIDADIPKEETMKVIRKTEVFCTKTDELKVGDVIGFTLTTGEEVEAMAMKREDDGMIFALVDCLEQQTPMVRKGKIIMQEYLKDIFETFPEDIRNMMKPIHEEDYLRLMTEKEVFGSNSWGEDEPDAVEQFEPMKNRRNREAFQGKDASIDDWCWYWLSNPYHANATYFAAVTGDGNATADIASGANGVRPAFKISFNL